MKRWFDRNKYRDGNHVQLLQSGQSFFSELKELIRTARHFIHLQFYIFDNDQTGRAIIDLLKEASQRGVKVFVVVDGYGSGHFPKDVIDELRNAGIHFKLFSPIHTSFRIRFKRRLHHKIVMVDGHSALIGGINIAQKYEGRPFERAWLDYAVKVSGPLCKDVMRVCEDAWGRRKRKWLGRETADIQKKGRQEGGITARLLQNDWIRRHVEISRFYRQSLKKADHSIVIMASYFLPGTRFRMLLKRASQRGVKITFVLGGISDVGFMKKATNFLYPFLLRNKIEVLEWKPSVLHAKLMVVDGRFTTVGSYNLNALSDYGSLELNVAVDDEAFAKQVTDTIKQLSEEGCVKIHEAAYLKQHYWWNQAINWMSYTVLRLSLKVIFFFMRK